MKSLDRREFLAGSIAAIAAGSSSVAVESPSAPKFKAAIIGHIGRGNYGHGLDVIFNDRADCEVVAIADADDAGRAKAQQRCRAPRAYADYREMLAKEKPGLVSIAPRHTDQHVPMALAAFDVGAHVFMGKPIAASPAECDQILNAAAKAKRKIAVAHQMRLGPRIVRLQKALAEGLIGDLIHIDAWGKQDDRRSGGEDMLVLGSHIFDLIRLLAGDPQWCTARMLQNGKDITKADARPATEAIGPVAGDEIAAQFAFANGVNATFNSRAKLRDVKGSFGMELVGRTGTVRIQMAVDPHVFVSPASEWKVAGRSDVWKPLDESNTAEGDFAAANRRLVDNWIDAIKTDREPTCSGANAAKAVEMAMAVYHAALTGKRVALPLTDRRHPLV